MTHDSRLRFPQQDARDDSLDTLLRDWHEENAALAADRTGALLSRLSASHEPMAGTAHATLVRERERSAHRRARFVHLRTAAAFAIVAVLGVLFLPPSQPSAVADVLNVPNGGRLEAFDRFGQLIGPCPLAHTDVQIEITGPFSRVTVQQQYRNPYQQKVEAVYTFPLSHNGAVDRMRMVIDGERIIEGEVKERAEARELYESAKRANHVAGLLEQERPNIFTQSVANIEPGASVDIEISYIEMVDVRDGVHSIVFPMTVAPRYIPGYGTSAQKLHTGLPEGLQLREGVVRLGPGSIQIVNLDIPMRDEHGQVTGVLKAVPVHQPQRAALVERILSHATPINAPPAEWRSAEAQQQAFWKMSSLDFNISYADGAAEFGQIAGDGVGHVQGRWFWFDRTLLNELDAVDAIAADETVAEGGPGARTGHGYERDTDQVPDASRITPMPVHPSTRAGHDISVAVSIATGGPAITSIESELHEVFTEQRKPGTARIMLAKEPEIPNRDFVLHWTVDRETIEEATFVHAGEDFAKEGGYFTLMLAPPARVQPETLRDRELIFVMDISGSMKGEPLAKSKAVLTRAIDSMRAGDTFNIITFAAEASVLWDAPRPATDANRAEALAFINSRQGDGGTEIMKAINLALERPQHAADSPEPLTPAALANLPADGREITVAVPADQFEMLGADRTGWGKIRVRDDLALDWTADTLQWGDWFARPREERGRVYTITGRWSTINGVRTLSMTDINGLRDDTNSTPLRMAVFLTDGEVGNDMVVIDAVIRNAHTTRVFAFGIGDSVNRYLLANMAHAGRGAVEFVTQESDRDAAVERFAQRLDAPVLTDITLEFSENLNVTDILPLTPSGLVPDVYDNRPIVIHGRYANAGNGTLTIRGRTGNGAYERVVELNLSDHAAAHDVISTLWARAKLESLTNEDLTGVQLGSMAADDRQAIIDLAVEHQLLSQFTSFIAIEKARVTIDGTPRLVTVPIELPDDADFSGFFGESGTIRPELLDAAVDEIFLGTELSSADPAAVYEAVNHPHTRYIEQLNEVQQTLATHDYRRARQLAITARVQLDQRQELMQQEQYNELAEMTNAMLAQIDTLEEHAAGTAGETFDRRVQSELEQAQESLREVEETLRQQQVHEHLGRVRELQRERRYGDALAAVDQVLFLDEDNTVGLALRDAIQTAGRWDEYLHDERAREFSYSWDFEGEGRRAAGIAPDTTLAGPRSTTGLATYPEDWPQLSLMRRDTDAVVDTLTTATVDFYNANFVDGQMIELRPADSGVTRGQMQLLFELSDVTGATGTARGGEILFVAPEQYHHYYQPVDVNTLTLTTDAAVRYDSFELVDVNALSTLPMVEPSFATKNPEQVLGDIPLINVDEHAVAEASSAANDPGEVGGEQPDEMNEESGEAPGTAAEPEHPIDRIAARIGKIDAAFAADSEAAAQDAATKVRLVLDPAQAANQRFYLQRVILLMNALVDRDHFDEARLLASWLEAWMPDAQPVGDLHAIMSDETLSNAETVRRVRSLAEEARASIAGSVALRILEARVQSRISDELQSSLRASRMVDEQADASTRTASDVLLLSVKVESIDDTTAAALRSAGLEIEDGVQAAAAFYVGYAAINDIPAIALAPGVRWVERVSSH